MILLHVNIGGKLRAGSTVSKDQIDAKHLAQLLRDELAEVVPDVVMVGGSPLDQALAGYAAALELVGERLVVVLDLVEAGGDAEALAFVDLMREHQTSPFALSLNERMGPLMARALDASERQVGELLSTAPEAIPSASEATADGPSQGTGAGLASRNETPQAAAALPVAATTSAEPAAPIEGEPAAPKSGKAGKASAKAADAPAEG